MEYKKEVLFQDDDLFLSESDESEYEIEFTEEDWMDWNSEHLLNMYMTCVEHYENQYLVLRVSFHEFCIFLYNHQESVTDDEYIPDSLFVADLYDNLVTYCTVNEIRFMRGVSFNMFKIFLSSHNK